MKNGKNIIFIIIGIVCFMAVAVLAFFIITDSNPINKDKIDPDKTVAWEDYVERYNMYASQNDLRLMSKDIETGVHISGVSLSASEANSGSKTATWILYQ